MVAQTLDLPNIRKCFIPDPGYEIVSADLAGADAQVVAAEAEDEDLKAAFRAGLKLHIKNARDIFPDETRDMTDAEIKATDRAGQLYHQCKQGVHLTNYAGTPKVMAGACKWPESKCEEFQERWFYLHPGIKEWHKRTERILQGGQCWKCWSCKVEKKFCEDCGNRLIGRTVGNKFGYRIIYFDRMQNLLKHALAWIPQSTVALNCELGALEIDESPEFDFVQILLQVHDELVFQVPKSHIGYLLEIKKRIHIPIPYDDPLIIQWNLKTSDKSWGDCE